MSATKSFYRKICSELIRALRGKLSRSNLNQKLGLKSNQVHRWESGQRSISWKNFCDFLEFRKISLRSILDEEFGYTSDPGNEPKLLAHLMGQSSVSQFAASTGLSKSVVAKILGAKQRLKLEQILLIVDRQGLILTEFLGRIVPLAELSVVDKNLYKTGLKNVQYEMPVFGAMLAALNLQEYLNFKAHPVGWLSKKLNLPLEIEEQIVRLALKANYLKNENGKLKICQENLDTRGNLKGTKKIRQYWLGVAQEKLNQVKDPSDPSRFGHYVVSVSDEADKKMRAAMYEYFSTIRSIILEDTNPRTQIRVLLIQDIILT